MNLDVLTLESAHWDNTETHLCKVALGNFLVRFTSTLLYPPVLTSGVALRCFSVPFTPFEWELPSKGPSLLHP